MKILKLKNIRNEAIHSLYYDNRDKLISSKFKLNLFYYGIPFIFSSLLISLNQLLNESSITYFITGISIFAGLFFNLLIVVSDKMEKRKKLLYSNYEPTNKYAKDYKIFSERLIASISYAIILSIVVIGLMFFTQLNYIRLEKYFIKEYVEYLNTISDYFFNFSSYFIGFQFLILLLHILTDIYDMLIHDMNTTEYQNEE
ncbi:hypothetical protein [Flavobacterium psychrophilum]|uniref:hypothetical protein n=1 Tax=Flavobacterium psychrophilum TaxID=96345 RepID=UPI000B7C4D6E|nr:hypothetical protein [Flavobacterium psychrophilum]EKT4499995.1 hypothetical protein [Flavobacterium psychrophilum]EKT4502399.1 hypothetical protein [Flavobacterium psychrophilum]ELM3651592.1 hypothetical protein [Flavobacterium psychrophilum]ELM3672609.1 hypothetical protein [Flavobacterium psychrophilum]ELM3727152.1 hypothetical protein [Flavobacterium psychrophilum]